MLEVFPRLQLAGIFPPLEAVTFFPRLPMVRRLSALFGGGVLL